MTYLLCGLATYFVVSLLQYVMTMPQWAWRLAMLVAGTGFLVACVPARWYLGAAVAGVSVLVQRIEDLLLVKTDEARIGIVRRSR